MAGDARLAVADDLLADVRPQPVRADQERAGDAIAGSKARSDRRTVLIVAHDFGADAQIDQLAVTAGFQENAVQIAAMHHRIWVAETATKSLAEIDMADFLRRHRIHQAKLIDIDRHVARGFADAEIIEGVKRVRPELDAGADLAECGSLLEQDRADAFLRETHRYGEAADAAARDQDRLCVCRRHQLDFPQMLQRVFGAQRHARGLVVEIDKLFEQRQQCLAVGGLERLQASAPGLDRPTA